MTGRLEPEVKKLVLWRIETGVPKHFKLSLGSSGTFSKEEMKRHVEDEDAIGLKIADIEMKFIKDLSSGEFSKVMAES